MFEGSALQDFERTTRGGFLIKIKPARRTCVVYSGGSPEQVNGARGDSIEQSIPYVVFLGARFQPALDTGQILLAECRRGRIAIPYRMQGRGDLRALSISTASQSDQFPVQVQHYTGVRQFLSREGEGHPYRYIVVDPELPRIDLVTLKFKNPEARILILKVESEAAAPRPAAEIDHNKVRATDLAKSGGAAELGANPVFQARIHLRNLELTQVRDLLLQGRLAGGDLQFVRTFLGIMIRNDQNKSELQSVRDGLQRLDDLYRFADMVLSGDEAALDAALGGELAEETRDSLRTFIAKQSRGSTDKETELRLWEWDLRLRRS